MERKKTLISWSSGKDSAWALYLLMQNPDIEVVGLLTTINSCFDRVCMHAVRKTLLLKQIESTGIEPWIAEIPHPCENSEYVSVMKGVIKKAKEEKISNIAFGDLFLEDVRRYREDMLAQTGLPAIEPLFPLWKADTKELALDMQNSGVKAYVTCVDPKKLKADFAGRCWDGSFLKDLPEGVDPCGENGEFHTFVYEGPMFKRKISVVPGEIIRRDGFIFADLVSFEKESNE